ncbi:metalloregulator ArsR/SmtB family transcription factor [Niveispirillum sp. BGYR6]|uniref:ArsR/SmtB family transcription factor n=1 Tax=Niveispirillum sp. BGYR6 TaxID=2971249 RepID=UPI0022B98A09|nr:metalloregulator ArsR/SmtB family transcription factor [Niveispirillum sp. BGYR6]MDG5494433.1 metalloregulator ArsR/SmtB family transcription factor [Niveispirillum sp. BGYR6]
MDFLLNALKAAAEPTRLRMLSLCAHGELSVTELTQILGQSQPRVSRHLKLLCEAGLLERFREGIWAYYRLAERGNVAELARTLVDAIPADDAGLSLDLERLETIKESRRAAAQLYFSENAARWHQIRSLHVPEREVEQALLSLLPAEGVHDLLDVGTGTGRMLELFGPRISHGLGIDSSREMLAVARVNLEKAGLRHCQVRLGDMYQLALPGQSQDAVIFHQVLHFAETPAEALAEAARLLRPGGTMLVVDFDRHEQESLRTDHAHRRLGFTDAEIRSWLKRAGLDPAPVTQLPGDPLTVCIWRAVRRAETPSLSNRQAALSGAAP